MARRFDRFIQNTSDPERTALLVDLLIGYAEDAPVKAAFEERVRARLRSVDPDRTITGEIARVFRSWPRELKMRAFGEVPEGFMRSLPKETLATLTGAGPRVVTYSDDVNPGPIPEFHPDTTFSVAYTGLFCREGTGDRWIFGGSDEPYVITTSIHTGADGHAVVGDGLRHPIGFDDKVYGDVDGGEFRAGPKAAVWGGKLAPVSVVAVVMERDEEDPAKVSKTVSNAVKAAAAVVEGIWQVDVPEFAEYLATELLTWIIDPQPDLVGNAAHLLEGTALRIGAAQHHGTGHPRYVGERLAVEGWPFNIETTWEPVPTDMRYFFTTVHDEDGWYAATFVVESDQEPLDPAEPGDWRDRIVKPHRLGSTVKVLNF